MKFSDRIGATRPEETIQVSSMNSDLRNSLWNVFLTLYDPEHWVNAARLLAQHHRKVRLDELPITSGAACTWIRDHFLAASWHEVYNLVEFLYDWHRPITDRTFGGDTVRHHVDHQKLARRLNVVLEGERSGFRLIEGKLAPISNKAEAEALGDAIAAADQAGMAGAETHLRTALELLSKKPQPDYRNAVKEAISAVESTAKKLANNENATLDAALKALEPQAHIHPALKSAFSKMYGYTSDADGIRHAIQAEPTVDDAEATYMVISCSAFVHYLIRKGDAAGLLRATH